MFSHTACRLVVGPEIVRGRGDGCDGGGLWGASVPPQVNPLMEMEKEPPPSLSARVLASARLPPPQ